MDSKQIVKVKGSLVFADCKIQVTVNNLSPPPIANR
jgi:hypothetical protein